MSNFTDKAKQVLSTIAPTLGTAIGGPFGTLAGLLVSKALDTPTGDDKAAETQLLQASPDTLLKLKQAELDFQAHMKELGITEEKLIYDDNASARQREIAVHDRTPAVLAYGVTLGFFGVLGFMLAIGKPKEGGDALLVMLGSLGTAWAGVTSYYFGSSAGAAASRKSLADIALQKT